jgi:hypothetical protein
MKAPRSMRGATPMIAGLPPSPLLLLLLLLPLVLLLATAREAAAIERNFAGSAQIDYHLVPAQKDGAATRSAFDGFTSEVAFKLAVDVSDRLSANVKACHGCHGFELPLAYLDYRVADELIIRAGRFSPSFGAFNLRHDPANHVTTSKPLPYDMGRMLRMAAWNLGVLPSPFPDNGVQLGGTHGFGEKTQIEYAAYAVTGFKADQTSLDLVWSRSISRDSFLVDNNGRPTVGGRLAFTQRFGEASDLTAGASVMYGTYDPANQLTYTIAGGDLALRVGRTQLRLEYLARRQTFTGDPAAMFQLPVPADGRQVFTKHGAYVEIERALTDIVTVVARADGLYRAGNVLVDSTLGPRSAIFRYTAAVAIAVQPAWRLKASAELWAFSNDPPRHEALEMSFHMAVVGMF